MIFDLDGTLVRSTIDFTKLKLETIRILSEIGLQTTGLSEKMKTYEIMAWVQKQVKNSGTLSYEEVVRRVTDVWNSLELENVGRTVGVPGASSVLRQLRNRGFLTGVVTRGCHAYAVRALEIAGLLPYVNLIFGRDDTTNPKPDPEPLLRVISMFRAKPSEVVMVGDSIEDLECAKSAGVRFIGVPGGVFSRNKTSDMDICLVDLRELPRILE